jgi:hypothetical protein
VFDRLRDAQMLDCYQLSAEFTLPVTANPEIPVVVAKSNVLPRGRHFGFVAYIEYVQASKY